MGYQSGMNGRPKPQVLCVDDEIRVIEGLALLLRKEYDVQLASNAAEGLQKVSAMSNLAVVISDMRMPGMDGASFLQEVKMRRPDATRILLTGEAGREGAIRAVNEGQIFRFLTKPCPIDQLRTAIEAGVIQHRLMIAERLVLQETLIGAIKALMEVLAIANPVAFGRASRIKRLVMDCAAKLGTAEFWQLEAAALLSQVGYVALPPALVEKLHFGERLSPEEQAKVAAVPDVAEKLLEHIPRLEPVIQILVALNWKDAQLKALGDGTIGLGTRILGIVLDYESQVAQGKSREAIFEYLRGRQDRYGEKIVEQLADCVGTTQTDDTSLEIQLRQVSPGMSIQQDIRTHLGALIVPKGFEVTKTFLERIANIAPELLETRVRVAMSEARRT
jgi:response regulator RpfG family c-di-GMP phosphodiesterase